MAVAVPDVKVEIAFLSFTPVHLVAEQMKPNANQEPGPICLTNNGRNTSHD